MSDVALRIWYRLLRRLGVGGLLGLAFLAAALALVVWARFIQSESRRLDKLLNTTAAANVGLRRAIPLSPFPTSAERDPIARLPLPSTITKDLRELFDAAARHGVNLTSGAYQYNPEPSTGLATYSVTLPIKERYQVIKEFTTDVLETLPHAALDDLHLERSDAAGAAIDGRIRFILYYRPT